MVDKKIRLLVVDDDIQMTIALEKSLNMEGYHVDTADNVQDALVKLSERSYRGVISDIRMEGESGLEAPRPLSATCTEPSSNNITSIRLACPAMASSALLSITSWAR